MDLKEIQNLIKFVAKSGASEVKLETGDVKITIKTGSENDTVVTQHIPVQAAPVIQQPVLPQQPVVATEAPKAEAPASEDSKYIEIKSPIIGTFYRKPAPDKPMFVEVGTDIKEGDVLCVIEAMNVFYVTRTVIIGETVSV